MKLKSRVRKFWCVLLALTMFYSPVLAYANPAEVSGTAEADLSYLPPGAMMAVVGYPRRSLTAPEAEMMPIEILSAAGKQQFGVDPLDIESVLFVVLPPGETEPGFGAVLRLARPYSLDDLKWEGQPYRRGMHPGAPDLLMPDDRTLLVGQATVLRQMLASHAKPSEGPLAKLMARTRVEGDLMALAVLEPVRPMLAAELADAPFPPPFDGLKNVPDLVDALKLDVGAARGTMLALTILAVDEEAAEQLERIINGLLDVGRQMALMQFAEQEPSDDPVEQAAAQYTQRISGKLVEMLRPERAGRRLRIAIDDQGGSSTQLATVGVLVALLLPAVQAARTAARRASSMNNLKQLALAMHNYHAVHGRFPARAVFDDDGKPLLSWRVLMLPYLEELRLYEEFRMDEPWDSEHNRKLIDRMPPVFHSPSSLAEPGKTIYLAPVGEGLLFDGPKGKSIAEIRDGTSNTILVLEANDSEAVVWTRPDDWQYDPKRPMAGLGNVQPGGFNAAFADGSVRFLSDMLDAEVLKALLTIAGGEVVPYQP